MFHSGCNQAAYSQYRMLLWFMLKNALTAAAKIRSNHGLYLTTRTEKLNGPHLRIHLAASIGSIFRHFCHPRRVYRAPGMEILTFAALRHTSLTLSRVRRWPMDGLACVIATERKRWRWPSNCLLVVSEVFVHSTSHNGPVGGVSWPFFSLQRWPDSRQPQLESIWNGTQYGLFANRFLWNNLPLTVRQQRTAQWTVFNSRMHTIIDHERSALIELQINIYAA